MNNQNILILTSTFPRKDNDTDPPFVYDLSVRLVNHYPIFVLCPNSPDCTNLTPVSGLQVCRFRYFLKQMESLAYGTGILNKLKKNKWLYILVPFFVIGEIFTAARLLKKNKFALINSHWLIPQGIAACMAAMLSGKNIPLVCTLHGGDVYALNSPILKFLKRMTVHRMDALLVVSHAIKNRLVTLGADENKIHVIPMGVDLRNSFIPAQPPNSPRSILFVGRLVEKKGLKYLIEAFKKVVEKYPDTRLTIVGKGPEEFALKKQVREYRIENSVIFMGALAHKNLPAVYQAHELAVFPFIEDRSGDMEGFGLVMVEAMGCGCTVIASHLPAVEDIIIDRQTGLLCEQQNPDQLYDRIITVFEDPVLRHKLARQGRQYVASRFDWSVTEKNYLKVFTDVMKKRSAKHNRL